MTTCPTTCLTEMIMRMFLLLASYSQCHWQSHHNQQKRKKKDLAKKKKQGGRE
jgi:hypothetical protein